MTPLDPDQVDVLARQLHAALCVPHGTGGQVRWCGIDRRRAARILHGLNDAGFQLTTTKES